MLLDGVLVLILVQAGGVFLGLAAVFVLLRASRSGGKTGYVRTSVRFLLRALAAVVLFVVVLRIWNFGETTIEHAGQDEAASVSEDPVTGELDLNFPPGEGLAAAAAVAGLMRADEPAEVTENARRLLQSAQRAGASPRQIRGTRTELIELLGDDTSAQNIAALDSVIGGIAGPVPENFTPEDSLQAVIADLRSDIARLDAQRDSLRGALEIARERRGLRTFLSATFDDLGLGFGWAAVYFTAFLAMMRGQTPGKRVLGIRVIRLDGKPLGWWMSFERFGGYAASFFLGLLGFAQILWDRNRQGLHDKACETVVINDRPQPATRK